MTRSSLTQVNQIGVETTPGTPVAARYRFQTLGIEPSPNIEVDSFRPAGQKYQGLTALNKEWVAAPLTGRGSYTEIVYALASVIDTPTITTPGGATNARLWTFSSDSNNADAPKTLTVQHGSSDRADRFAYGIIPEFGMNFTRSSIDVSGSFMARALEDPFTLQAARTVTDGVTTSSDATVTSATAIFTADDVGANISGTGIPAGTTILSRNSATSIELSANATASGSGVTLTIGAISSLPLKPILATEVSVYLDDSAANLGNTKLTRVVSASFNLSGRFGPLWVLDAAQDSWVEHIETEPSLTMGLTMEANSVGMGLLQDLRNNDRAFIRVEGVGEEIESGQNYTFTLDFSGEINGTGGFTDQEGLYAIDWQFLGVQDTTWGKAFEVKVKNGQTAL